MADEFPVQRHEMSGLGQGVAERLQDELVNWSQEAGPMEQSLWMLEGIRAAEVVLENAREQWVRIARGNGITWDAIGEALGITKQGAAKRYGS